MSVQILFEEHTSIEHKIVLMDVIKTTSEVQHDLAIKQDFCLGLSSCGIRCIIIGYAGTRSSSEMLGNVRSNFAENRIYGRGKTHTILLTEFGQCCLLLRTCYRSFIINQWNFYKLSTHTRSHIHSRKLFLIFLEENFYFFSHKKNSFSLEHFTLVFFFCFGMIFLFTLRWVFTEESCESWWEDVVEKMAKPFLFDFVITMSPRNNFFTVHHRQNLTCDI